MVIKISKMKFTILTCSLVFFLLAMCISCEKEDRRLLDSAFSLAAENPNLKCLIVYKDGQVVREKYFHAGDSLSPHDVRSVTKSVMATLIGIAIDKGYIVSEDETIGDYIRPLFSTIDSAKASITIRDLLSMSSGISGDEFTDPLSYNDWANAPDQLAFTLNSPMDCDPGQVFTYNNGAAHLISAVLTQATGMSTFQFATQYLFEPLGITYHTWLTDKQGIYNGAAGLYLTPYDMLKIGQLYLDKGVYNGVRIVSEEWINKASSYKITTNDIIPFGPGYGYFWWIGDIHRHNYYFANGYGGQFIVVVPDINLIVIATNKWSGLLLETAKQQWYNTIDMILNSIIPIY
jgi:CubicO group peptidase (beta-lactamase class C family)